MHYQLTLNYIGSLWLEECLPILSQRFERHAMTTGSEPLDGEVSQEAATSKASGFEAIPGRHRGATRNRSDRGRRRCPRKTPPTRSSATVIHGPARDDE